MANFPGLKMTAAGRELQAKAQTGQLLKFTRVALGDGLPPADPDALVALVNECQTLSIQRQEVPGDGTAVLRVIMTNQGVATGFYMRELATFAEDPDTGAEVLYSYSNAGDECDFLPAEGAAVVWEGIFDLVTVVGNAENVTAVIDDYITIALKSEVDALKPRLMPEGGTVGQMVRKASNAEGDVEYFDPELDGFDVRLTSIEEPRTAVANQRVFTLQKTVTNGLAVYINGERLSREAWTALSATQLQLDDPLPAGTRVLFVNNEEAGPGRALNVSLTGPTLVYPASSNSFTITDFDSFSVYTVAATAGTVTRNGAAVTLDVPAEAEAGTLDLVVTRDNVRATYRLAVGAAAIAAPEILAPLAGATNVNFEPDLAASAFVVYPAGYDSHAETRWQVARDLAFTDLVFDQQGAGALTAVSLAAAGVRLDPSTRYYVRAQYHGVTLVSAWSAPVAFNTTAVYVRRPAIISPMDGQENVSTRTFKADPFSVYGGADTHAASRWQVSTVADFSTVLADSGWSTGSLTSWTPPVALAPASPFFVRVRYRAQSAGDSDWSPAVGFVTSDPLHGTYTTLASGPAGRALAEMVSCDGYLYVMGGSTSGTHRRDVWRYDPAQNLWRQMADMPVTRATFGAAEYRGKIYVAGGLSSGSAGAAWMATVLCYDPALDTWGYIANLPQGLYSPGMAVIDDSLYVVAREQDIGGGRASVSALYRYDPQNNAWVTLKAPPAYSSLECAAINGRLYVHGSPHKELAVYDPGSDAWTVKPMPSGHWETVTVAVSGLLYIHGGYLMGDSTNAQRLLKEYDPATDVWRDLPMGPYRRNHCGAELGGSLYIFGGSDNGGTVVTTLTRID